MPAYSSEPTLTKFLFQPIGLKLPLLQSELCCCIFTGQSEQLHSDQSNWGAGISFPWGWPNQGPGAGPSINKIPCGLDSTLSFHLRLKTDSEAGVETLRPLAEQAQQTGPYQGRIALSGWREASPVLFHNWAASHAVTIELSAQSFLLHEPHIGVPIDLN